MQIEDLKEIGRLGNRQDENGFVRIRKNDNFQPDFLLIKDIFLVFQDNRVRYVTVEETTKKGQKDYIKILEREVIEEAVKLNNVKICLPPEYFEDDDDLDFNPLSFTVDFNGTKYGQIKDYFLTPAYLVFVIDFEGKEIMIPDVDKYVKEYDLDEEIIYFQNIRELAEYDN